MSTENQEIQKIQDFQKLLRSLRSIDNPRELFLDMEKIAEREGFQDIFYDIFGEDASIDTESDTEASFDKINYITLTGLNLFSFYRYLYNLKKGLELNKRMFSEVSENFWKNPEIAIDSKNNLVLEDINNFIEFYKIDFRNLYGGIFKLEDVIPKSIHSKIDIEQLAWIEDLDIFDILKFGQIKNEKIKWTADFTHRNEISLILEAPLFSEKINIVNKIKNLLTSSEVEFIDNSEDKELAESIYTSYANIKITFSRGGLSKEWIHSDKLTFTHYLLSGEFDQELLEKFFTIFDYIEVSSKIVNKEKRNTLLSIEKIRKFSTYTGKVISVNYPEKIDSTFSRIESMKFQSFGFQNTISQEFSFELNKELFLKNLQTFEDNYRVPYLSFSDQGIDLTFLGLNQSAFHTLKTFTSFYDTRDFRCPRLKYPVTEIDIDTISTLNKWEDILPESLFWNFYISKSLTFLELESGESEKNYNIYFQDFIAELDSYYKYYLKNTSNMVVKILKHENEIKKITFKYKGQLNIFESKLSYRIENKIIKEGSFHRINHPYVDYEGRPEYLKRLDIDDTINTSYAWENNEFSDQYFKVCIENLQKIKLIEFRNSIYRITSGLEYSKRANLPLEDIVAIKFQKLYNLNFNNSIFLGDREVILDQFYIIKDSLNRSTDGYKKLRYIIFPMGIYREINSFNERILNGGRVLIQIDLIENNDDPLRPTRISFISQETMVFSYNPDPIDLINLIDESSFQFRKKIQKFIEKYRTFIFTSKIALIKNKADYLEFIDKIVKDTMDFEAIETEIDSYYKRAIDSNGEDKCIYNISTFKSGDFSKLNDLELSLLIKSEDNIYPEALKIKLMQNFYYGISQKEMISKINLKIMAPAEYSILNTLLERRKFFLPLSNKEIYSKLKNLDHDDLESTEINFSGILN